MTPQEYAKLTTERIDKIVDLNDYQTPKVFTISENYGAILIAIRASNDEVLSRKGKITGAKTELEKSLEKILSKEQFAKYKAEINKDEYRDTKSTISQAKIGKYCDTKIASVQ